MDTFSAVEVEIDDEETFDFTIDFTFNLKVSETEMVIKVFTIGKYQRGGKKLFEPLRVLNKSGYGFKSR